MHVPGAPTVFSEWIQLASARTRGLARQGNANREGNHLLHRLLLPMFCYISRGCVQLQKDSTKAHDGRRQYVAQVFEARPHLYWDPELWPAGHAQMAPMPQLL